MLTLKDWKHSKISERQILFHMKLHKSPNITRKIIVIFIISIFAISCICLGFKYLKTERKSTIVESTYGEELKQAERSALNIK